MEKYRVSSLGYFWIRDPGIYDMGVHTAHPPSLRQNRQQSSRRSRNLYDLFGLRICTSVAKCKIVAGSLRGDASLECLKYEINEPLRCFDVGPNRRGFKEGERIVSGGSFNLIGARQPERGIFCSNH